MLIYEKKTETEEPETEYYQLSFVEIISENFGAEEEEIN